MPSPADKHCFSCFTQLERDLAACVPSGGIKFKTCGSMQYAWDKTLHVSDSKKDPAQQKQD
jgi:hypothetical protein